MATPRWIGHDRRGNQIFAKDPVGRKTGQILTDFPQVSLAHADFVAGKDPQKTYELCYSVAAEAVLADSMLRLNAQSYKPSALKQVTITPRSRRWTSYRLGDVVQKVFYPGRFKREYVDPYPGAVPFLGGAKITEILWHTDKWLRHDDPRLDVLCVKAGWVLITRSGSTGIVSSVPPAWDGFAISEHVIRIVPDPNRLDPAYLLAYLRTKVCQEQLRRGVFGSVIDEISPEFVSDLEIPVPKNIKTMQPIVNRISAAESARNEAIVEVSAAVAELNALLLN